MLEYRDIYAGGRLLPAAAADLITVANPATEEIVGSAPAATRPDVDTAARAARLAFDTGWWPRAGPAERAAALDRLALALEARALGPLVSPRHRAGVESYVAASTARGARLAAGGRRPAAPVRGYYYQPTVLAAGPAGPATVFGPVVSVIPYGQEADLVALLAGGGCARAGSVWTADLGRGLGLARRLQASAFGVNGSLPDLGGPECLDAYLRPSAVFLPEPAAVS